MQLSLSPTYNAAHKLLTANVSHSNTGPNKKNVVGVSVRFPRFVRLREDKTFALRKLRPENACTTTIQLAAMMGWDPSQETRVAEVD